VPVSTPLTITAHKVACHVGLSYEAMADYDTFSNAVRIELQARVVDVENQQLIYGDGMGTNLHGFTTAAGILTFDATGAAQGLDAIEEAITALRVGNALGVADLLILNPTTWSAIRRTKDTLGRYLVQADPTVDAPDSLWGVPVVTSTVCNVADGILVDTTKFGRAVVQEPLSMRIGWANDDFTKNILRTVCEERLNLAVERPAAVCWIKNLPSTVSAEVEDAAPTKRGSSK
jgi:HK97 family phage major capsid protein